MSATPPRPVVVFDCDNTLVTGDVLRSFITDLLGHGPRMVAAVAASPVLGAMLLPHATRRSALSTWLWIATVGRSDGEIERRMDDYVDQHLGRDLEALIADGMARLAGHRDAGDRVVIATAAAEPLARRLLAAAGLGDLEFVSSPVRRTFGGWTLTAHCWGPFKPDLLAAAGIAGPYRAVYSDSFVDVPVLRLASEAVLVNPARLLAKLVRHRLPDLTTVSWA